MLPSPFSDPTAHMAALFVKHLPRGLAGVYPPEALPAETRQAILADARTRDFRITLKVTRLKKTPRRKNGRLQGHGKQRSYITKRTKGPCRARHTLAQRKLLLRRQGCPKASGRPCGKRRQDAATSRPRRPWPDQKR